MVTRELYRKALYRLVFLVVGTVLVFDFGCFFTLPEDFSGRIFLGYRVGLLPDGGLGRGYPHHYYEPHPDRGFDIGISKSPREHFLYNYPTNYSYPIWSNSLGCFDSEHSNLKSYLYLAGDSFTWGYTRFEKKFGTLLEQKLHIPVVKCGVSHTGQLHQLSKMRDVVSKIGTLPAVILVVWCPNDIINDFFHPHSTVIDGWQVDTTYLTSTEDIVRENPEQLSERLRNKLATLDSVWRKPKLFFLQYSATFNILLRASYATRFGRWLTDGIYDDPDRRSIYAIHPFPPVTPVLPYLRDKVAQKNQEALLQFQAYADKINAKLFVALLSAKPNHNAEVREFLHNHSIKYVDLGTSGYNLSDRYLTWRIDPHANERGNEVIAEALYDFIKPQL